jgi:hypothetical protein
LDIRVARIVRGSIRGKGDRGSRRRQVVSYCDGIEMIAWVLYGVGDGGERYSVLGGSEATSLSRVVFLSCDMARLRAFACVQLRLFF